MNPVSYLLPLNIMCEFLSFPHAFSASRSSGGRPLGHLAPPLGRAPVGRSVLRCRTVGTAFGRNGGNLFDGSPTLSEKNVKFFPKSAPHIGASVKTSGDDKLKEI